MSSEKEKKICSFILCKKKLSLAEQSILCKCQKQFCMLHRQAEEHLCSYNFQNDAKKLLEKQLVKSTFRQVEQI